MLGILKAPFKPYNSQPWSKLNIDSVATMVDYSMVVIGPGDFNYSASYGFEATPIAGICELGKSLDRAPLEKSPNLESRFEKVLLSENAKILFTLDLT